MKYNPQSGALNLAKLLKLYTGNKSQCTDVRDRIYSLISIASNIGPGDIILNCSKTPIRLLFDVLHAYINLRRQIRSHTRIRDMELCLKLQHRLDNPL
jgi:hypothetical protein